MKRPPALNASSIGKLGPVAPGSNVLVVCNGEPPPSVLLRRWARAADVVLAADGGANMLRDAGLVPNVVIGDLDSVTPRTRRECASSLFIHRGSQDSTDLEKALDFCSEMKAGSVVLAGATGGRLDFTLGNLAVLWRYVRRFPIVVRGDGWHALTVTRQMRIEGKRGALVSIIPFGACRGVTLRGLHYPLREAALPVGRIGASNVVEKSPFTVSVKKGKLLVVVFDMTVPKRSSRRW